MPVRRPKLFKLLTSRAQRMFRKFLEPRPEKRPGGLADLTKFLEDRWLTRTSLDRQTGETNMSPTADDMFLGSCDNFLSTDIS
jgi:serine/threonine-protein kinase SBK